MMIKQKKEYEKPCTKELLTETEDMLTVSGDPVLHTTSDKASNEHEALTKENNGWSSIWE